MQCEGISESSSELECMPAPLALLAGGLNISLYIVVVIITDHHYGNVFAYTYLNFGYRAFKVSGSSLFFLR